METPFPKGFWRAMSFIASKFVNLNLLMAADHHTVAGNFRNPTGGGNAERLGVAGDDGRLGKRKGRHRQTVDKEVFRKRYQTRHGSLHGQMGCAEDVDLIDFCD